MTATEFNQFKSETATNLISFVASQMNNDEIIKRELNNGKELTAKSVNDIFRSIQLSLI